MKTPTAIYDLRFTIYDCWSRRTAQVFTVLFLLLAPGLGARAQDGPAIMRKVQAAYAALKSFKEVTGLTETQRPGRTLGTTAEFRFLRPNFYFLTLTNPASGTTTLTINAREMIIYNNSINAYQKRAVSPGKKVVLPSGVPDPIFFLQGGKAEAVVSGLKAGGTTTLNGIPCYLVTGSIPIKGVSGATRRVTFWVDSKSYLLWKVRDEVKGIPVAVRVPVMKNGKRVSGIARGRVDITRNLVIHEMLSNPPLKAPDFNFTIPKGAVEQNLEKYLKSGR
jgi:outer membrane lipoprotein-sorting protein